MALGGRPACGGSRRGAPRRARGLCALHSAARGLKASRLERRALSARVGMPPPRYSVVVVGAGGVGKSAITISFVRGQYAHHTRTQAAKAAAHAPARADTRYGPA